MNWQAINFDWNQVRAFLATVDEGSLSAAARALGQTQPTLGRQVTALEEELNLVLFERSGRHLIPTPAALEMAAHVREMAEAATRLSLAASSQTTTLEGPIKISATEMYSAMVMPHFVKRLRAEHPGIVVDLVATNAISDLRHREADIAVRNTDPKDPDMIARRLADEEGALFATTEFIEEYGPFETLGDLEGVPFIGFGSDDRFVTGLREMGVPARNDMFVARSENHLVHWELTQMGLGIGVNGIVLAELRSDVQPILPDKVRFRFPVWLVAPRELKTNARVRVVFDALAAFLADPGFTGKKAENSA
ncbi:MAG: LysR family transcriptional regulator [Pseudomonadota bacterium]